MQVARNRHNEVLKFYIRKTTYHFSKEFYVPKLCGENSDQSCSNEPGLINTSYLVINQEKHLMGLLLLVLILI